MKRWAWLIPCLLAAAIYFPSLSGHLVWDDEIVQHRQMVGFQSARDVFFPSPSIYQWPKVYYRPVVVLTYLFDQALFGPGSKTEPQIGPHATLLGFHLICTFFVWVLARQVLVAHRGREWGAVAAASIFGAHPIHTETVCWISGRSDAVAAMFMLPAIVVALHFRNRPSIWSLLLPPVFFMLALLSKEVAVVTIAVIPVLFWLAPWPAAEDDRLPARGGLASILGNPAIAWRLLFFLNGVALLAYYFLRKLNGLNSGGELNATAAVLLGRAAAAAAYYLWYVVIPWPQSVFPSELPSMAQALAGLAVYLLLALMALWLWRRGQPELLLCLLWFVLTLAPSMASAVRVISETPVAERYLYIPSVGWSLLIGWLLAWAWARRGARALALTAALALTSSYAWATVARGRTWMDDVSLWTAAARSAPNASMPHHGLGGAAFERGKLRDAIGHFETALRLANTSEARALAHNNLGMCYLTLSADNLDRAEEHFQAALREPSFESGYESPYYGLAQVAMQRAEQRFRATGRRDLGQLTQAQGFLEQVLEINDRMVRASVALVAVQLQLAQANAQAGDLAASEANLAKARAQAQRLAQLERAMGEAALKQVEQARQSLHSSGTPKRS
jgi:tetratricopeptide (TPR) repeat protein